MEEKFNYDTQFIDRSTGEVFSVKAGTKLTSPERQEQQREYALKKTQTFSEKNELYKETQKLRGNFFAVLCRETKLFHTDISEPTLGKLIYMATYIDVNNCICKDGGWQDQDDGCFIRVPNPMTKAEINDILNISRQSFSPFWNECINKKLIIESDGAYYLSKELFRFGSVHIRQARIIKMFKHAIRYMYENTDERSKKTLIYLYRLIPFINLSHNGLCSNPLESDKNKINPLSLGQICKLFGIDRRNQVYFLKKLKKLRFTDKEGKECSVIKYTWLYYDKDIYWITINPQFYSGYIQEENMVEMINEFRLEDNIDSFDS